MSEAKQSIEITQVPVEKEKSLEILRRLLDGLEGSLEPDKFRHLLSGFNELIGHLSVAKNNLDGLSEGPIKEAGINRLLKLFNLAVRILERISRQGWPAKEIGVANLLIGLRGGNKEKAKLK